MKKILSLLMLLAVAFSFNAFSNVQTASAIEPETTTHQVTFMLDRVDPTQNPESIYQIQTINHNSYANTPETPSIEGRTFIEWQTEDYQKFSFRTRIVEDTVLYASFEGAERFYNVTFMLDGEPISIQRVKEGENAIEPKNLQLPEGTSFSRWNQNFNAIHADLLVEAVLAPVYYSVRVYANFGDVEPLDIITVRHGTALDLSSIIAPQKPNYVADGFNSEIDINSVKSNGDVYVNYVPAPFVYTFMNGSVEFETTDVRYGETAKMPVNNPSAEEDYYFAGWAIGTVDGEMYDVNTLVEGDLTLYAVFKPTIKPKYEVKFFDYNGTQYGATQIISEGGSAIAPGHPPREGYIFNCWNTDFSNVTANLDIYPIYILDECTVTFVDYLGVVATEIVLYGQSVAIDESLIRTKDGYEFVRFDRSLKNITGDTTINAVYRVKTYNVRFYSSNLNSLGGLQQIKHGQNALAPNPEKEGYTFLGWKNLKTSEIESTDNITKDCEFVATYSRNVYTVTFMEGDTILHSEDIEYGRGFPSYTYDKEGYKFDGWYLDKELTNKYHSYAIYQNTTLYARWIEIIPEKVYFTVTYFVDGAVFYQQVVERGASITTIEAPQKEGYKFFKWHTDQWEYTSNVKVPYNVNSDWAITALYDEAIYTVTFKYGNSQYTGCSVQVKYGEPAVLPEGTNTDKTGHTFKGWDKDISYITSNVTVNAVYEPFKYTVEFRDADNNLMFTQIVNHGEYIQWVDNPVKEGYTFAGWSPSLSYNTAVTEDGKIYKALFNVNSYKIYYYVDGVLWSNYTTNVAYGSTIYLRGEPSINKETKKFLGWSEAPETMPAHDLEIFGTTYTYQYFNVYYLIDGEVWRTKNIREGKEIGTMTVYDVPNEEWKDAHENIVFKHWGDQPYYMPAEDVYVHAVIEKYNYYKAYFYVDGELYKITTNLEGKPINTPNSAEIQAMFDETKVFDGWGDLEWYMPSHDVEAHAEFIYKNYYTLNYYIEGKLFRSFTLLEGTDIEDTEYELSHADVPNDYLPEFKEFRGWSRIPQWMPKEDVRVDAHVHEYKLHKVTYKVDFDTVAELEVREGQPIPQIDAPESDGTRWFIGWSSSYETMPGYDIQVSAWWNYLNVIETKTVREDRDGVAMYKTTIKITDVVNFVAIKFKVTLSVPAEIILDEEYASYNTETGVLIYASGELITEDTDLITFYCGYNQPIKMWSFVDFEIYTINEQGEIVSTVCYMNNSKHEPKA